MNELGEYKKFYFLEDYLFGEVNKNFKERGYLTPEEFFAIVFWKRKASGVKIALKWDKESIESVTKELAVTKREKKLEKLLGQKGGVKGIGIAIASAILTVCYPNDFTVVDYRVLNSLKEKLKIQVEGKPEENPDDYLKYVDLCKIKAKEFGFALRDFDRVFWTRDWYEGKKGLKEIVNLYKEKIKI